MMLMALSYLILDQLLFFILIIFYILDMFVLLFSVD